MGALLGPQRLGITIGRELAHRGITGDVAAITAGWQEREQEVEELDEAISRRSQNLRLHARCDEVFASDQELFLAHREKQDLMRKVQGFHRVRLHSAIESIRSLLVLAGRDPLAEPEVSAAFEDLRTLDARHTKRLGELQDEFEHEAKLFERAEVARHREEIQQIIDASDAVAIAGGHVASLLNRLRLFGVAEMLQGKPVFAWSAGAMVLTERVIVFHDHPPQGRGDAEVVAPGLGLFRGIAVFPHAKRRLDLTDPQRVILLARRFGPDQCVTLDEYSGLRFAPGAVGADAFGPTKLLGQDGVVVELGELEEQP